MIEKINSAVTWVKENQTTVQLLAIAIGTLTTAIVAYNIAQAISRAGGLAAIVEMGILTVQVYALDVAQKIATISTAAFGAAVNFLTSPITLVILAIGALIAIGVLLYKNWDTIKAKASEIMSSVVSKFTQIKNKTTEIFSNIYNTIKNKIDAARNFVKNAIDKIKGFFNFKWSLPKLKMPHVTIKGKFSLVPPSVPSFGISWYKKAMNNPMILDSPTIFGEQNGRLLGAGEAGPEVVAGRDTLMNMIQTAVNTSNARNEELMEKILSLLSTYIPQIAQNNPQLVLDTGVLVGEISPNIDRELGLISRMKERGR